MSETLEVERLEGNQTLKVRCCHVVAAGLGTPLHVPSRVQVVLVWRRVHVDRYLLVCHAKKHVVKS